MKIIHIIPKLNTGGSQWMLFKVLVAGQADDRFEQSVLCLGQEDTIGHLLQKKGITVHYLRMSRPTPALLWKFIRFFRHNRADVVVSWLFVSDFLSLITRPFTGIPQLISNLRSSAPNRQTLGMQDLILLHMNRFLSARLDGMLHNAQEGRRQLTARGFVPGWWHYIPNGFELDRLSPDPDANRALKLRLNLSAEQSIFGCFARYHPSKDYPVLLQAFAQLVKKQPSAHLLLVGRDIDDPHLAKRIEEWGVQEKVTTLGEVTDVAQWMSGLDVAVLASCKGEGFPNFLGEAMCCGVPCVATDSGDSAHVVGQTGIIVPTKDVDALSAAMEQMMTLSHSERSRLGQAARERMEQHFDIHHIAEAYHRVYLALKNHQHPDDVPFDSKQDSC
ncbi:glycosyltransferase [Magnetococcus sp. PR-3]|uniref:glycosyltransferase n=1 Tax=Magnetococcus sp. PR-3 TaxID=3120355 RepID=UPI002FCE5D8C